MQFETFNDYDSFEEGSIIRVRNSAQILIRILTRRSESKAQFSVTKAIHDIALDIPRPDLAPAFYAELLYLFRGLYGRGPGRNIADYHLVPDTLEGRKAAIERSKRLDKLSDAIEQRIKRYSTGIDEDSIIRRRDRRNKIRRALGATEEQWNDWRWQIENILKDAERISELVELSFTEKTSMQAARESRLPFGITPHYLSLMDDDPEAGRDRAIRAQVIPTSNYVCEIKKLRKKDPSVLDFMREIDTSPANLITRRYPGICIFKPFNTCPQICVYCQRNWEIEDAMSDNALASDKQIKNALKWIAEHPGIHDVLITGGDPLAMSDENIERITDGVADIPSVKRIRIGTRTLITMPMRITEKLADILAGYRIPGHREVAVVTHAQHPYELTPDTITAVEKLRIRGISVYNQQVYTFHVSRRFETFLHRKILMSCGIEPYYTFSTKGKEETVDYRVPIARLLQEQKEEARLLPGLSRTDEAVYNVPGLGKNYLRARHYRDLISILPNGARVYEFHPWEKNISKQMFTYISEDVPILDYLQRLDAIGEDISEYETIWYYF